jgi:glycosyltransferase involved in cell wall biosynthesis
MKIIQYLRSIPIFNRYQKGKTNIFISIYPQNKGGGSNTFSFNLKKWLLKNKDKYHLVHNIFKADKAIVIADKIDIRTIEKAKEKGCFIIHRLDEYVEPDEDEFRRKKHSYIKELNRFADVTVYQSNFVFENMHPFLDYPEKYEIIHNGADPKEFYPNEKPGEFIGHITWGVGDKKRLDILYETIKQNPDEKFLLIGNHNKSRYNFTSLPHVTYAGQVTRRDILHYLHQMKFLFFPSEKDPCPNTAVESIMAGVPVCYNLIGGTKEIVKDCGEPIERFEYLLNHREEYRQKCFHRKDLYIDDVIKKYLSI